MFFRFCIKARKDGGGEQLRFFIGWLSAQQIKVVVQVLESLANPEALADFKDRKELRD